MISPAPLLRLLAEKGISNEQFSQLTGIPFDNIRTLKYYGLSQQTLDIVCRVFKCQPCDVIEFRKDKKGGHWEWISD